MPSRILRLWNPDAAAWEEVGDSRLTTHIAAPDPHEQYLREQLADAKGDLLAASANDAFGRLGVGTDGHVLTADSAQTLGVKWAAAAGGGGGMTNPMTAKGDLIAGAASPAGTPTRIGVGTDGQVLTADAAQALGVKWATPAAGGGGGGGLVRIQEIVVGAPQATLSFTSIPQTHGTLVLELVARSTAAGTGTDAVRVRFNNDTGADYDEQYLLGSGGSPTAGNALAGTSGALGNCPKAGDLTNAAGYARLDVAGYAATTFLKQTAGGWEQRNAQNSSGGQSGRIGVQWRSTAAVTRIDVFLLSGATFATGSRAVLYGVDGGASAGLDAYTKAESDALFLSPTEGDAAYLKLTGGQLSGNLGVGVAPEAAWGGGYRGVRLGSGGVAYASLAAGNPSTVLGNNTLPTGAGNAALHETWPGVIAQLYDGGLTVAKAPAVGAGAAQAFTNLLRVQEASFAGSVVLSGPSGSLFLDGSAGYVAPHRHNAVNLGSPTIAWTTVYATNGTIQPSAAAAKEAITPLAPEDALAAVRTTDPVVFDYRPPERTAEWYELPDDPEQAEAVLLQRLTAAPLEAGARHQAGFVLNSSEYACSDLFETGEGQSNAANSVGILIGAVKALLTRVEALEGA